MRELCGHSSVFIKLVQPKQVITRHEVSTSGYVDVRRVCGTAYIQVSRAYNVMLTEQLCVASRVVFILEFSYI